MNINDVGSSGCVRNSHVNSTDSHRYISASNGNRYNEFNLEDLMIKKSQPLKISIDEKWLDKQIKENMNKNDIGTSGWVRNSNEMCGISPDKSNEFNIKDLMVEAMRKNMNNNQSESINELAAALAKAQGEFTPALKDSANPFFKSKYANLCSIVKACQEPLSKNGLSISQATNKDESGSWVLTTTLMHSSGQWLKSITPIITLKADIQSFGSACTYARRYSLAAIAGVTTDEDDDGEGAMNREGSPAQKKYEAKKQESKIPELLNKVTNTPLITDSQGKELSKLLAKCSQTYQDQVWKHLLDNCQVTCYDEMSVKIFDNLISRTKEEIAKKEKGNEGN